MSGIDQGPQCAFGLGSDRSAESGALGKRSRAAFLKMMFFWAAVSAALFIFCGQPCLALELPIQKISNNRIVGKLKYGRNLYLKDLVEWSAVMNDGTKVNLDELKGWSALLKWKKIVVELDPQKCKKSNFRCKLYKIFLDSKLKSSDLIQWAGRLKSGRPISSKETIALNVRLKEGIFIIEENCSSDFDFFLFRSEIQSYQLLLLTMGDKKSFFCLRGADMRFYDFHGLSLIGEDLTGANLVGADLTGVNLADANLTGADMAHATFESIKKLPPPLNMLDTKNLWQMIYEKHSYSLIQMRNEFKKAGLHAYARQVNHASKHNKGGVTWHSYLVYWLLEWPSDWGEAPLKPIFLMLICAGVFSIVYWFIAFPGSEGCTVHWMEDGVEKPNETTSIFADLLYAILFSLICALRFGWRWVEKGTWLTDAMPKELLLKPVGWCRPVYGLQSLISKYMIFLFLANYFGGLFRD